MLYTLSSFLHNIYILFFSSSFALLFKLYLLGTVLALYAKTETQKKNVALLGVIVFTSLFNETYWAIFSFRKIINTNFHSFLWPISRVTWIANIILWFTLSLFIESILRNYKVNRSIFYYLKLCLGVLLATFFLIAAFSGAIGFSSNEIFAIQSVYIYILILGFYIVLKTTYAISYKPIPKLLNYQLRVFIWLLIFPYLMCEIAPAIYPWFISSTYIMTNYGFLSLSSALLTYAMYFCARKLIGLRFLNVKDHVEINYNFNFVKDFKKTLNELGRSSSLNELQSITQQFFDNAFEVPGERVHLYIRDERETGEIREEKQIVIEQFLNNPSAHPILNNFLYESKIFIKDEVEFSGFYNKESHYQAALTFLKTIKADLFLPIYNKQKLIGYVVIEQNARPKRFYNSVERDEMTVFSAYLNSIINLLRNRNLDALLLQEKDLTEELYSKHQEINQYKESIRSFIRTSQDRTMGLMFYKNKKFAFGNQAAHDLLACDPNVQKGHPIAGMLKQIVANAQKYGTTQTKAYQDSNKKLIITAMPNSDISGSIITLHYPEITDTIKLQSDLLKDPSQWDYLLYLETTESGQLVNQLVPGSGATLLNFKIDLLKTALSKKATLLTMAKDDLMPTVELLHTISLRKHLHTIKLTEPERDATIAIKLFGLNPLLSSNQKHEPLLEFLHTNGTLYIENIHLLSLETQEYLAEFLRYGAFRTFKSEHKITSNVRVICSSSHNLASLIEKQLFCQELFNELKKTSLTMPALNKLSAHEFQELADGFTRQTITTKSLERVLNLNTKETATLYEKLPSSFHELRKKIYNLLIDKTQKNNLEDALEFGAARLSSDPELSHAITLGKEALKNQKTMEFLWRKFKSQTKIATLLGVNRSSVNRRCKKYHLI
jgi:transcriptional regulator with GAF, ATPase, and Fis domain